MKRILAEYNVKRRKGSEAVKTRRYKKREERHGISRCSSHYTRHCVLVDHSRGQCTLSNRYTHTPKFSIFSDWQEFGGRLWVCQRLCVFVLRTRHRYILGVVLNVCNIFLTMWTAKSIFACSHLFQYLVNQYNQCKTYNNGPKTYVVWPWD